MNRIVVKTHDGDVRISRHIYGHFSEHLGRCIYGGYWVGNDKEASDCIDLLDRHIFFRGCLLFFSDRLLGLLLGDGPTACFDFACGLVGRGLFHLDLFCRFNIQIENGGKKGPWGPLTSALIP